MNLDKNGLPLPEPESEYMSDAEILEYIKRDEVPRCPCKMPVTRAKRLWELDPAHCPAHYIRRRWKAMLRRQDETRR